MHLHFVFILILLLVAAGVHAASVTPRTVPRAAELVMKYLLVGYCGVPMLVVSLYLLISPERAAAAFGFTASGPVIAFFGWAYLGMSILSLLALYYRGAYLVAPVVVWAVYLGGATFVHLGELAARGGGGGHGGGPLEIFAAHGLVGVLLVLALLVSGAWRGRG